jgi:hypothetical protein
VRKKPKLALVERLSFIFAGLVGVEGFSTQLQVLVVLLANYAAIVGVDKV